MTKMALTGDIREYKASGDQDGDLGVLIATRSYHLHATLLRSLP